jgi:hypothetical protein
MNLKNKLIIRGIKFMKNFLVFIKDSLFFKNRKSFTDILYSLCVYMGVIAFIIDVIIIFLMIKNS